MRRRDFIAGLGGAAAWPLAARAQQGSLPKVGYLSGRSVEAEAPMLSAFREGLAQVGYVEGRNLETQYRFADGEVAHLQARATANPGCVQRGSDPAQLGLVASFSRPGGNTTGAFSVNAELTGKMLGLLHDLVPRAMTIAMLQPGFNLLRAFPSV